ncbi:hypothetical protein HID58_006932 [Brassica napus]|uniref:Uncharacterized protein n=1 Tax=Brassica napus TaxID=3708 RepID=A0ABQ8EFQ9_BRANA|nr:hypothetical protein HID58_006932 [Brassica napus]
MECPDSSPLRNLFTPSTHIKHDLTFNAAYSSSRRLMANSFVFLTDLNLASVLSPLRCDFSGSERHVKNWGELIGIAKRSYFLIRSYPFYLGHSFKRRESSAVTNRRSWTSVTKTTYGILDFSLQWKEYKEMMELMVESVRKQSLELLEKKGF